MKPSQNDGINVGHYLSIISRRRWLIIVPFCLAVIVGMVLGVKLPKIYEASTLIPPRQGAWGIEVYSPRMRPLPLPVHPPLPTIGSGMGNPTAILPKQGR